MNDLIEELTKCTPTELSKEALKLFDTIMAICDERDELRKNIKFYDNFTREQLIERCEYLQRSCERKEEQRDDAVKEYMEQEDYKERNKKAIEYIEKNLTFNIIINNEEQKMLGYNKVFDDLLDILRGDKE